MLLRGNFLFNALVDLLIIMTGWTRMPNRWSISPESSLRTTGSSSTKAWRSRLWPNAFLTRCSTLGRATLPTTASPWRDLTEWLCLWPGLMRLAPSYITLTRAEPWSSTRPRASGLRRRGCKAFWSKNTKRYFQNARISRWKRVRSLLFGVWSRLWRRIFRRRMLSSLLCPPVIRDLSSGTRPTLPIFSHNLIDIRL